MKEGKNGLLFLASGKMELCWLYAYTLLLFSLVGARPVSLPAAMVVFWLAFWVTGLTAGRGWRVYQMLALHLAVFAAAALWFAVSWGGASFDSGLLGLLAGIHGWLQWLAFALSIFCTVMFWLGGAFLFRRGASYGSVTSRFELGVVAFILFFLVAGGRTGLPTPEYLLYSYFIFCALALALAKNSSGGMRQYMPAQRWLGPVLAFAVTMVFFGGAAILLFLPYLTLAAQAGYSVAHSLAQPLAPYFINFVLFIFGYGSSRMRVESGETVVDPTGGMGVAVTPELNRFEQFLMDYAGWGTVAVVIIAALLFTGIGLYHLLRWLLAGTETDGRKKGEKWSRVKWLAWLLCRLGKILAYFRRICIADQVSEPVRIFTALMSWGRSSGLHRLPSATPCQYGMALVRNFPELRGEIEIIVNCFNTTVYGGRAPDGRQLDKLRRAWKRIKRPGLWPMRLKMRLGGAKG